MIDERFNKFLKLLIKLEGGVSNHPDDGGGLTNLGVTQAAYDEYRLKLHKPKQTVEKITSEEAADIYKINYYDKISFVTEEYPHYLLFDLAVNSGVSRAKQCIAAVKNPHNAQEIMTWRRQFYNRIVAANPKQSIFLKGWMSRLKIIQKEFE